MSFEDYQQNVGKAEQNLANENPAEAQVWATLALAAATVAAAGHCTDCCREHIGTTYMPAARHE